MTSFIQNHYQTLAKQYDQFWASSPDFIIFLTHKIIDALQLVSTDHLVDLGCGTGIFSQEILNQISLDYPIVCVDPSDKMLAKIPQNDCYQCVNQGAIEFSEQQETYNKILIKEMIHHIPDKQTLLENLFNQLIEEGILLIILLPPTIEYPLFAEALRTYEKVQPHYNNLVDLLDKVGFKTKVEWVNYDVSIAKDQYFEMVENRYMSLLSRFDDQQLQDGLTEMKKKYQSFDKLEFCDRFVFLIAQKPKL